MKDVAPRIFRTLETPAGRAEFDTIVTAAVAAYGSLRAPSEAQAIEFGRLVAPLWDSLRPETRRALAAALSHTTRMPAAIVDLVVDAPLEIAAPFLVSAPTLTQEQISRLEGRGDDRVARILEGRCQRGLVPVRTAARAALPRLDAPSLSPEAIAPAAAPRRGSDAAAFVRDTLRRIAQADLPASRRLGTALLTAARGLDPASFFDKLQADLQMSAEERRLLEADDTGMSLALVLKREGVAAGEALAILMLVHPRIGLDVQAFEEMAARYRSLVAEPRRPAPPRARRA